MNGLDDHNGIIDHRSDDQYEGKECEHVQRETDGVDDGQGGDQRYDDGDGGDDGGAPAAKEYPHDDNHQQQGFEQGLYYAGDGGVEEVFLALQILDDDAWRQRMAYLLHLTVYLLDNLVGIGTCHLVDADVDARLTVGLTYYIIVLRTQFHTGYVADAQDITTGQRTDDQLFVFLLLLVAAAIFQHVLESILALSAQRTCGHLNVLLVEHLCHIGWRQPIAGHLQRVEPDAHGVVGPHHVHFANTWDTTQTWFDVDFCIVGQKRTVEGRVWAVDGYLLDVGGLAFADGDTTLYDVARQTTLYGGGTVLYIYHRHIGVCALTEEDADAGGAVVRGRRCHVHHTLYTVDGLFQGYDDTLLYGLSVSACV